MSQKKRTHQDNYLNFGFTYLIQDGLQISQCVLCMKTFSNSTMKSAPLKQHRANAHPSMISKNRSFFELKLYNLKRQKLDRTGMFWKTNNAAVLYIHHLPLFCLWQKLKKHIRSVKLF